MHAVILAAGTGSRMNGISAGLPKCLLRLSGETILFHSLKCLEVSGIERISVISGFGADILRRHLPPNIELLYYPGFLATNNLHTLAYFPEIFSDNLIIAFADVFMPLTGWTALCECSEQAALLIDQRTVREGTMRIQYVDHFISDIGSHIPVCDGHGTFTGIAKFEGASRVLLGQHIRSSASHPNSKSQYYTEAIRSMIQEKHIIAGCSLPECIWGEVDTPEDYVVLSSRLTLEHP